MNSYSKVFKAPYLSLIKDVKVLAQPVISVEEASKDSDRDLLHTQQLIQEAEVKAKSIIEKGEQLARDLENAANEKISKWWEDNYQRLEELANEAKQKGYQEGFDKGKQDALLEIELDCKEKLEQAQNLLHQAYEQKETIISEAEPFLLEISTVIASQIIKHELEINPDRLIDLIKQHILRFKEKEFITICVHPDDFEFIQAQRDHLIAVVNGETEIKIIPDHSVSSKGCIIRTAYGSVDARIDTQIEEIKKVILEGRREP